MPNKRMARMDIGNAQATDMSNSVKPYSIPAQDTDGIQEQKETTYQNTNWTQQFGYFNQVPDLKSALLLKATWNVGKGYTTDPDTQVILDHISGTGKDSFEDILFNMEVTKRIGGDAYAEIIRDPQSGEIINLKTLNPGTIKIVYDDKGIIKEYRQVSRVKGTPDRKIAVEKMWHMSHNRVADQIHGISDIDAVAKVIQADEENFDDMKKIMHRGARPMILWKLKTDDQTKIAAFVAKIDAARNLGEDMFIPDDEDIVTHEIVQVDVSANVLAWRDDMRNKFYRVIGLPQVVPGGGGQSTESESKVIYLAFEQIVEKDQKNIERQVWEQLQLKIDLVPPATLSQNLQQDEAKDANNALNFQQGELSQGGVNAGQ